MKFKTYNVAIKNKFGCIANTCRELDFELELDETMKLFMNYLGSMGFKVQELDTIPHYANSGTIYAFDKNGLEFRVEIHGI